MQMLYKILFVNTVLVVITDTNKQDKNYGQFDLRLNKFELCKGPKRINCCNITSELINSTTVDYNLYLKLPTKITKGKIVASVNDTAFLRLQMKNPCDHVFIKPILGAILNVSRNCAILPGRYRHMIDIAKIAETYYSGMFLYGTFTFKSLFLADNCNFSCTTVVVDFVPKIS